MKKYVNGKYIEMTPKEIEQLTLQNDTIDLSYDEKVNNEIRKKYSQSQEFAILRQKDYKPEEYAKYFAYCEECKKMFK
jgi:hypothetical protein